MEVAERYIDKFTSDYRALELAEPDVWARATEYIAEDMEAVDLMTEHGYTYETADGVYYDTSKFDRYADFERSLPLFAVGRNFLASHAEPSTFYDFDHILNYRINEDVVFGLTWTDNYQSMPGTIDVMLDYYIPENDANTYYFGGHRPIKGIYNLINGDRYVQIHNPRKQIICIIDQNEPIDLNEDIFELIPESTEGIDR